MTLTDGLLLAASFLSGSIPFGLLITRAKGIDIRTVGSGNIGATNVGRALGKKYFILCLVLDALKGLLPVLAAGFGLGAIGTTMPAPGTSWVWLACMAAAVLGHVFCPWLKFKGGKGVATSLGALLGVFPVMTIAGLGTLLVWAVFLKGLRYMSLASMIAAASLPAWVTLMVALAPRSPDAGPGSRWQHGLPYILVASALGLLVIWAHRANIARLRAGTEPRFGAAKPKA